MKAHEVAEHILAKIDGIVQSEAMDKAMGTGGGLHLTYTDAERRLKAYCEVLDAVTRYAAVEPKERKATGFA